MENVGVTVDVGHALVAGENVAEAVYRLIRAGKLFHMHFNDNYTAWDDDMIVGSVHTVAFIEWLRALSGKLEAYGYEKIGELISRGMAVEITREIRELIL